MNRRGIGKDLAVTHAICLANFWFNSEKILFDADDDDGFEGGLGLTIAKQNKNTNTWLINMHSQWIFEHRYRTKRTRRQEDTYWGIIGAGKVEELPLKTPGIGLGRDGGIGGSRVANELPIGLVGACVFIILPGLDGRFLENRKESIVFLTWQSIYIVEFVGKLPDIPKEFVFVELPAIPRATTDAENSDEAIFFAFIWKFSMILKA